MQYTFETNIRDAYENIGLPDEVIQENDLTIKASSWQEALVKRMKEPYGPVFMAKVRSVSRDGETHTFTVENNSVYVDVYRSDGSYDILKLFFGPHLTFEAVAEWLMSYKD